MSWGAVCPACKGELELEKILPHFACPLCNRDLVSNIQRAKYLAKIAICMAVVVIFPLSYALGELVSAKYVRTLGQLIFVLLSLFLYWFLIYQKLVVVTADDVIREDG